LLIRVPLAAMIEVDFPKTRPRLSRGLARRRRAAQRRQALSDRQYRHHRERRAAAGADHPLCAGVAGVRSLVTSFEEAARHLDAPRLADDLDLY